MHGGGKFRRLFLFEYRVNRKNMIKNRKNMVYFFLFIVYNKKVKLRAVFCILPKTARFNKKNRKENVYVFKKIVFRI